MLATEVAIVILTDQGIGLRLGRAVIGVADDRRNWHPVIRCNIVIVFLMALAHGIPSRV